MLVLSRKLGERVILGDGIVVTVTEMNGQRVKIGIEAPAEVRVLRGELVEAPQFAASVCRNGDAANRFGNPSSETPQHRGTRCLRRIPR